MFIEALEAIEKKHEDYFKVRPGKFPFREHEKLTDYLKTEINIRGFLDSEANVLSVLSLPEDLKPEIRAEIEAAYNAVFR